MTDKEITREEVLDIILQDGYQLKHYPNYKDDYEIVMAAVKQNGRYLQFASHRLRNDKEVVMAAITAPDIQYALLYASDELKNDKEVVMEAVKRQSDNLCFASDKLKDDIDIAEAAYKQCSFALWYASDRIKLIIKDAELLYDCNDKEYRDHMERMGCFCSTYEKYTRWFKHIAKARKKYIKKVKKLKEQYND